MKIATVTQRHGYYYCPKFVDEETKATARLNNLTKGMQPQRGVLAFGPRQVGPNAHMCTHCTVELCSRTSRRTGKPPWAPHPTPRAPPALGPCQETAKLPPGLQLEPSSEHPGVLGLRRSYPSQHMGKLRHRNLSTTRETDKGLLIPSLDQRISQKKMLLSLGPRI